MITEGAKIPEFKFKGVPLTQEQTELVFSLIVNSKGESEVDVSLDENINSTFLAEVAIKRMRAYNLPFKITNYFFVASVITFMNTPGMVMGMLWIAKCYADRTKKDNLTIQDWCELFPWGAPTQEECDTWWDSQKVTWERHGVESDNMVDYLELWGING